MSHCPYCFNESGQRPKHKRGCPFPMAEKDERLLRIIDNLMKCVDLSADGKPVKRGQTLYLMPGNNPDREPMTLHTQQKIKYCWYSTAKAARKAAQKTF